MTDSMRRQRRLLAVRELQADLAAAHLRMLRSQQEELRQDLVSWQGIQRVDAHAAMSTSDGWMLACAEGEIATLHVDVVRVQMDQQQRRIDTQAADERERRVAREQMQRLCDRASATAREMEERTVQGRLDDIFSAARLRRIADAADRNEQ